MLGEWLIHIRQGCTWPSGPRFSTCTRALVDRCKRPVTQPAVADVYIATWCLLFYACIMPRTPIYIYMFMYACFVCIYIYTRICIHSYNYLFTSMCVFKIRTYTIYIYIIIYTYLKPCWMILLNRAETIWHVCQAALIRYPAPYSGSVAWSRICKWLQVLNSNTALRLCT